MIGFAIDIPPNATGQATGSSLQHGFPTQLVAQREQPYEGRNILYESSYGSLPDYEDQKMFEDALKKVERLLPLFNQRLQEAVENDLLPPFSQTFAEIFTRVMKYFALNPKFVALSFSVTEDKEFELSRVNEDRTSIDYFTLGLNQESGKIESSFNRIQNRKSIFNTFGKLEDVLEKVVDFDLI